MGLLGCWLVVHRRGSKYSGSTNEERGRDMEVEKHHRGKEGKNDGDGRGEAFEDIVRIFDDNCCNETTKDLDRYGSPRPAAKVAEEVAKETIGSGEVRGVQDGYEGRKEGKQGELNVAYPKIGLGILENHLKVHPS